MDKSRNKNFLFLGVIKRFSRWIKRSLFIIIAAAMIGFTNAFNNESRCIYDSGCFDQQEQLIDDDDTNE
ncbi:MAG: hypothetical protein JW717_06760 [Marinilabiliaceae bacterium]|jgi:hypothetical protein|nr:hypothetical protein [Marinilabiliaceae bacterium]